MHDLLLKNGKVIDPAQQLNGVMDIAVEDGKIARIAADIPDAEAKRVIDVKDRIVTAGLIDPHVHVYEGFTPLGIHPDLVGVQAGVTTLADAGSCGPYTYQGFPVHVIPQTKTDILVFLNVGKVGLALNPEIANPQDVDTDAIIRVIAENRSVIKGVKARMVSPALDVMGMEMPRLAIRAARETGTPVMFHIGHRIGTYNPNYIKELLPMLQAGDIITHIYCDHIGGVLDSNRKLIPEAKEAVERGVWMDVGYGQTHFGFDAAQRIIDGGVQCHSISSDITTVGRRTSVHSFVEMMTRFLALGFSLEDVITMSTTNAARVLGIQDTAGALMVGRQADVSVLDVRDGNWRVDDCEGGSMAAKRAVVPALTLKRGEPITPEWGPRPWGWEPDPA